MQRTRNYVLSAEAIDTPLAPPSGNPSLGILPLGCPSYSSSEPFYTETILIEALEPALAYLEKAALTPGFKNPPITLVERPAEQFDEEAWEALPDESRPLVTKADPEALMKQLRDEKNWERLLAGEPPASDTESDGDADEVSAVAEQNILEGW